MTTRRITQFIAVFAALCIALASTASAMRMAPSSHDNPELQAYLAAGGSLDEICATSDLGHEDHDCPFCRLLSDPELLAPKPVNWHLIPSEDSARLSDLTCADQRTVRRHHARAPPLAV